MRLSLLLLTTFLFSPLAILAGQIGEEPLDCALPDKSTTGFRFPYDNGLYATVVGYQNVGDIRLFNQRRISLRVPGARGEVPVRAIIQNGQAPLVVMLPGIFGNAGGNFERVWQKYYAENGWHVLTLDSPFLPYFTRAFNEGVAGYIPAEAEQLSRVIRAFLDHSDVRGRVGPIGVVGISYGGLQALTLGRMARQGRLPFPLAAVQAWSPPIRLDRTAEIIDTWHREDRWRYTLIELYKRVGKLRPGAAVKDSELRGAIAADMRLNLAEVVLANDTQFRLGLIPNGNEFDDTYVRKDHAQAWTFTGFIQEMSYPYWARKNGLRNFDQFIAPVDLLGLLRDQPCNSTTFITKDDPLNAPDDSAFLESRADRLPVVLLPHGGHLGYVSNGWVKERLLTLFDMPGRGQPQSVPVKYESPR